MATKLLPRYTKPLTASFRPSISPLASIHPSNPFTPPNRDSRQYHSADHPAPPGPFNAFQAKILEKAIVHVPSHGFTLTSLGMGAREVGLVDASVNVFERGAWSLVGWHFYDQRVGLKGRLSSGGKEVGVGSVVDGWDKMSEGERVREVTWRRLMGNKDVIGRWQEALALSALPSNIPPTLKEIHLISDEILYLSGSIAVDFSWYTKRLALSTIYAATELFMTTDKSEGFKETREFMERRFEESESFAVGVKGLGQWVGMEVSSVVGVLRSKGVWI